MYSTSGNNASLSGVSFFHDSRFSEDSERKCIVDFTKNVDKEILLKYQADQCD